MFALVYDDGDRAGVRHVALAVTAIAWVVWIGTSGAIGSQGHAHGLLTRADAGLGAARWLVMLAAMMTPVLIEPIQYVRSQGLVRRRARATVLFVTAYGSIWSAGGAAMFVALAVVRSARLAPGIAAAAALAAAAIWQCSPAKQACLNRCHLRFALPVFGRRADAAVLGFGATHAVWCIGTCGLWMLALMALPGWHLAAMMAVTVLVICERLERTAIPRWRWRGPGTALRVAARQVQLPRSAGRWARSTSSPT